MVKKRKKRLKKLPIFILIFCILIGFVIFTTNSNNYKLKKKGYNESEINLILKDKDLLNYILKNKYNHLYLDFVKEKDYQFKNLDKYLNYYNNNKGVIIKDAIYLVNNNIDKPYSKNLMEIIKEKYYIKDRLDRYLSYLEKTNKKIKDVIINVNSNIDYDFYTHIKDTDMSKGYLIIANKYYKLDKDYKSKNLVDMGNKYTRVSGAKLEKETYEAFKKLSDEARTKGYYIVNTSAYRSYNTQNSIYNDYKNRNGLKWADAYSARPGHSEHQTGLALDVGTSYTTLSTFENTKEFTWIKDNAHKYGFILRYPKGKQYITGYEYEPWHYRYVGVDVATFIYENDLTFEEYYAYYIEKESD